MNNLCASDALIARPGRHIRSGGSAYSYGNHLRKPLVALGFLAFMAISHLRTSLSPSKQYNTLWRRFLAQPHTTTTRRGIGHHYVTLQVGSPSKNPPKRLVVALDSEATAFPCSDCEATCDDSKNLFDPSSSAVHMCPDQCLFVHEARCEDGTDRCIVTMEQPDIKEGYVGYEVQDHVGLYTSSLQKHSSTTFPLTFHCQTQVTPSMSSNARMEDGILGLSTGPHSFISQMHAAGRLSQMQFALCFRELPAIVDEGTSAGSLTLGSIDRTHHATPLVWARNAYDHTIDTYLYPAFASTPYAVHIRRIYLGIGAHKEDILVLVSQGSVGLMPIDANVVAVDGADTQSATTSKEDPYMFLNGAKGSVEVQNRHMETLLHHSAEPAFRAAFSTVTGINFPSSSGVHMTQHQYNHLPTILLQLEAHRPNQSVPAIVPGFIGRHNAKQPYDIVLAIAPRHYMHYDVGTSIAVPTLSFHRTMSRLGTHALQGREVVFDLDHDRIGLAEKTTCPEGISLTPSGPKSREPVRGNILSSEGGTDDVKDEWVPEDVASNTGTEKQKRTEPAEDNAGTDPVVTPGEGGRPKTAIQVDESVSVTSDASPTDATNRQHQGNGLPGELDEGGESSQAAAGGTDRTPDPSTHPVNEDGVKERTNTGQNETEVGGETSPTEEETIPGSDDGGNQEVDDNEKNGGVEKDEEQAGLPQASQGEVQPAFQVGPGAVPSREALGNVNNTAGGNGFWNLIGLAAFFAGFFVTVIATRDNKTNSRDKNYVKRRTIAVDDCGTSKNSIGKGKGGSGDTATTSKQPTKGKGVWPFGKSGKQLSSHPEMKASPSSSTTPSRVGETLSDGRASFTNEDTTVFTKDDRTMFTSGHTSYFHSNSGHASPESTGSDWQQQRHDDRSFYTGDYKSHFSGDESSFHSQENQDVEIDYQRSGYSQPENWKNRSRSFSRGERSPMGPSTHSTATWEQPTFHNQSTSHLGNAQSIADEESFY